MKWLDILTWPIIAVLVVCGAFNGMAAITPEGPPALLSAVVSASNWFIAGMLFSQRLYR